MVEIRRCVEQDFDKILPLLQQLWPDQKLDEALLTKVFAQGVGSPSQVYLCATIPDRIVGFSSLVVKNNLWQAGPLGHIDELVVDSHYRGHGIGTQLLVRTIQLAKERGCRRVELDTGFHRKAAHRFYEQQGFENRAYLFSKVL